MKSIFLINIFGRISAEIMEPVYLGKRGSAVFQSNKEKTRSNI